MLIALLDPAHVDHDRAGAWFERQAGDGWATCAITENGTVRILSSAGYSAGVPIALARRVLADARGVGSHVFWPCDVSMLDDSVVDGDRLHGANQVTDVYLLALAVAHGAIFATFDRSIARTAVAGASGKDVVVL